MSVSISHSVPDSSSGPLDRDTAIPLLENGDRLTADEFLRRYEAMPGLKKAELIEGVVHVPSPFTQKNHGAQHSTLIGWLFAYRAKTPGVELGDNSTVFLGLTNTPQPDCLLFIQPEHGGRVKMDPNGYIVGAPDLVAEVAASSVSYDLHDKRNVYRRHGVREYLVWRVLDGQIDWYVLRNSRYMRLAPKADGILQSTIFPGLWLDPAALLAGDLTKVLTVVQRGLETPEHAAFEAQLQRNKATKPGLQGERQSSS